MLFQWFFRPGEYGTEKDEDQLQERISAHDLFLERKIADFLDNPKFTEDGLNNSHTVYLMRPRKHKTYKYVSGVFNMQAITQHIAQEIGETTDATRLRGAHLMYLLLLGQAETRTSAGWIFESRMHLVFQRGGNFEARQLGGANTFTIGIDNKPYRLFSKVSVLGSLLRIRSGSPRINPDIIGVYFRPQQCNLCSVDSFVITKSAVTDKPVLVLFQLTVSGSHPVKSHGLANIWDAMPAALKETPPILVFVC